MNTQYNTNILLLGKTGVGKSSLLNYLFGADVAKTGAGRPVTEAAIIQHQPIEYNNVHITIYDSWGLEPDNASQWKKLVESEIHKHDQQNIFDWFHTIIYCVDAKRARFEKFEQTEVLQPLIESGNYILFVLTKADLASDIELNNTQQELQQYYPNFVIIPVQSVSAKLLSGETTKQQGKEEVLQQICKNLRKNIVYKHLKLFKYDFENALISIKESVLEYFEKLAGTFGIFTNYDNEFREKLCNYTKDYSLRHINFLLKKLEKRFSEIDILSKNIEKQFLKVCNQYLTQEYILSSITNNFSTFNHNFFENLFDWKNLALLLIPDVMFIKTIILSVKLKSFYRDQLKITLDVIHNALKTDYNQYVLQICNEEHIDYSYLLFSTATQQN